MSAELETVAMRSLLLHTRVLLLNLLKHSQSEWPVCLLVQRNSWPLQPHTRKRLQITFSNNSALNSLIHVPYMHYYNKAISVPYGFLKDSFIGFEVIANKIMACGFHNENCVCNVLPPDVCHKNCRKVVTVATAFFSTEEPLLTSHQVASRDPFL